MERLASPYILAQDKLKKWRTHHQYKSRLIHPQQRATTASDVPFFWESPRDWRDRLNRVSRPRLLYAPRGQSDPLPPDPARSALHALRGVRADGRLPRSILLGLSQCSRCRRSAGGLG